MHSFAEKKNPLDNFPRLKKLTELMYCDRMKWKNIKESEESQDINKEYNQTGQHWLCAWDDPSLEWTTKPRKTHKSLFITRGQAQVRIRTREGKAATKAQGVGLARRL